MPKAAEWRQIYNSLYNFKINDGRKLYRHKRGTRVVECPNCFNNDMEKICKLRNDFYQCEVCNHKFDKDMG